MPLASPNSGQFANKSVPDLKHLARVDNQPDLRSFSPKVLVSSALTLLTQAKLAQDNQDWETFFVYSRKAANIALQLVELNSVSSNHSSAQGTENSKTLLPLLRLTTSDEFKRNVSEAEHILTARDQARKRSSVSSSSATMHPDPTSLSSPSSPPSAAPMSIKQRMAALAGAGLDTGSGTPVSAAKRAPLVKSSGLDGLNGYKTSSGQVSPGIEKFSGSSPFNGTSPSGVSSMFPGKGVTPSHSSSQPSVNPLSPSESQVAPSQPINATNHSSHSPSASLPPPRHQSPPPLSPTQQYQPRLSQPPPKPFKPSTLSANVSPIIASAPFIEAAQQEREDRDTEINFSQILEPNTPFDATTFEHQFPSIIEFETGTKFVEPPVVPSNGPSRRSSVAVPIMNGNLSSSPPSGLTNKFNPSSENGDNISNGFPILPDAPTSLPVKGSRPLPSPPQNAASLSSGLHHAPTSTSSSPVSSTSISGGVVGSSNNPSSAIDLHGLELGQPPSLSVTSSGSGSSSVNLASLGHTSTISSSAENPSASMSVSSSSSSTGTGAGRLSKPEFPLANTIFASALRQYLTQTSARILLLDVRPYAEFRQGHIPHPLSLQESPLPEIVNVDPQWLNSSTSLSSTQLGGHLPPDSAFHQRASFDLVVIYNQAGGRKEVKEGTVGRLGEMIYEREFGGQTLKRAPVVLMGGWEGWESECRLPPSGFGGLGVMKPLIPSIPTRQGSGSLDPIPPVSVPQRMGSNASTSTPLSVSSPPLNLSRNYQPMTTSSQASYQPPSTFTPPSTIYEPFSKDYTYPSLPRPSSSSANTASSSLTYPAPVLTSPPPLASPSTASPNSRRRTDYIDQASQAYSGAPYPYQPPISSSSPSAGPSSLSGPTLSSITSHHSARPSIDYPNLKTGLGLGIQQPPMAAAPSLERQSSRGAVVPVRRSSSISLLDGQTYGQTGLGQGRTDEREVVYWGNEFVGMSGLKNLGNTCYQNSTLQCLSATVPFSTFFRDGRWKRAVNTSNVLGTKGNLAQAYCSLISTLWSREFHFVQPLSFRKSIVKFSPIFDGTEQHDSQEFLAFLLDGLHEDLNRVLVRPEPVPMTSEREAELNALPPQVAGEKEWVIYQKRNDSVVVDLFQGQYRSRMECLTCHQTSTTYDAFMYLSLPVPTSRLKTRVSLDQCLDTFVREEVMEKGNAWNCPKCKKPRTASKSLSLSRLPPVLLIHLKRFSSKNGVFWDKAETVVDFPIKYLDLTKYMPAPLSDKPDPNLQAKYRRDARTQTPPYVYELYAVSNHTGSLSSGHYTAYVKSSQQNWKYCDDRTVTDVDEKNVMTKNAYILLVDLHSIAEYQRLGVYDE
ncbi:cysteine proteinase [Phaffia rhodozyma]|uniref:ubiquitinyl hydrolase 1 n=1 Tax=Phaffia rhodozyma TaxID=264483 RepID=A0A0F7SSG6_PHARH|nr:cysteine proteinase [Phaffia rhodozyma]